MLMRRPDEVACRICHGRLVSEFLVQPDAEKRCRAPLRPGVAPLFYTASGLHIYAGEGRLRVTKRLIDLDDELLASAQRELNTTGVSDTVRAALQQAASAAARARQVTWLREGGLETMADSAQRADVWR
jgi:Arc/MetJ family transcription regulator